MELSSKVSSHHRDYVKKEGQERKKNILHLILKYLMENNLNSVADLLQSEAQISPQYQVCDNIDLEIILQEYQSYYHTKFQKYPKILRKPGESEQVVPLRKKSSAKEKPKKTEHLQNHQKEDFQFEILPLSKDSSQGEIGNLKSLCDFPNYSSEWREMADQVIKQIIPANLGVTFQDCIGLNETVETLKEAVIYPSNYPDLFDNINPWKGILLFGPPGTGKTQLAKALACESSSTFINVTSSVFISKWRGESEKMVKVLFDIAKFYAPTTIFIDEIDSLISTNHESIHEASRRFKTELLTQIDGIIKNEEVFVLATTNTPWAIDNALLRRFEKRILVPLPDKTARFKLFRHYLNKYDFNNGDEVVKFVELSENFSGSDIKIVCKEVEMAIVRERLNELKSGKSDQKTMRKIRANDIVKALQKFKPCLDMGNYQRYVEWGKKHASL